MCHRYFTSFNRPHEFLLCFMTQSKENIFGISSYFPDSVHFRGPSIDWLFTISAGNTWVQNKFHPFLFSLIFIAATLLHIYWANSICWTLKIQRLNMWSLISRSSEWNWSDSHRVLWYSASWSMAGCSAAWCGMAWKGVVSSGIFCV